MKKLKELIKSAFAEIVALKQAEIEAKYPKFR